MTRDPRHGPPANDNPDIQDAIDGHQEFRRRFENDRDFFEALTSRRQAPRLLWIGCSDSRVVPSQITNAEPGELFEIRNIANVVPPSWSEERSVGAAIEYAISHLGIDDIVVCGHTGCGGLAALSAGVVARHETHLTSWIEHTRGAHQLIAAAGLPESERDREIAKAHAEFQTENVLTYAIVREAVTAGRLAVHTWLYDMAAGRLLTYDSETGVWEQL